MRPSCGRWCRSCHGGLPRDVKEARWLPGLWSYSRSAAAFFLTLYSFIRILSFSLNSEFSRSLAPSALCLPLHLLHLVFPSSGGTFPHLVQTPVAVASCRRFAVCCRRYSFLSGRWFRALSYSFRSNVVSSDWTGACPWSFWCFAFFFPVGAGVLAFLPGSGLCCIFPGRAKENWKVRPSTRECGGTLEGGMAEMALAGLSPRLRGNRGGGGPALAGRRSIPAPAGEPVGRTAQSGQAAVYPRACGGTEWLNVDIGNLSGLSPRLRGNHWRDSAGRG